MRIKAGDCVRLSSLKAVEVILKCSWFVFSLVGWTAVAALDV